jgi:hypothetical protein
MTRLLRAAVLAAPTLLISLAAYAAPPSLGGPLVDGSVVRTSGCGSYFFIAYRDEFALAQWLGGEMAKDGDVLQVTDEQSSFEREGRMTLLNFATNRTIDVSIEKALMNRADFTKTAAKICKTGSGFTSR